MAEVVRNGSRVVNSHGYYLNSGFSTGGGTIIWEDLINKDPMPEGLSVAEQARVLGGEACMCKSLPTRSLRSVMPLRRGPAERRG